MSILFTPARIRRTVTTPVITLLLSVFAITTVAQPFARTEFDRFKDWSYKDASAWIGSWDGHGVASVAGATLVLAGISFADQGVSDRALNWGNGSLGPVLDVANELGGAAAFFIPTALFATSLTSDNIKFQDAAFTSLQSYVYSNTIVVLTKFAVGRSRPDAGNGPHDFNPFSGATSFPSGHTSSIFAIVMPWVFYYPGPVTYSLVAVASVTAVARIQRQRHWLTDVLAGAAISTAMSHYLFKRHQSAQAAPLPSDRLGSALSARIRIRN
jgi:membrane-associated phospholipid phosphatase